MKLISNDQPRHFSLQVDHHFLLAITEKLSPDSAAGGCAQFGFAFVDTSIGTFHLGHFDDDRYRSRLSTLLTRYNPVEIISARRNISAETRQVCKLLIFPPIKNSRLKDSIILENSTLGSTK